MMDTKASPTTATHSSRAQTTPDVADHRSANMDVMAAQAIATQAGFMATATQVRGLRSTGQHEPRRWPVRAIARRAAAVLAAAAAIAVAPLVPAHAAVSDSAGTLTAGASCNRYYNTMTMSASVSLSNRFPNGATVAVRYAYYNVNVYGQRTTAHQYTGWQSAFVPSSTTYVQRYDYFSDSYYTLPVTGQAFEVPKVSISARGTLIAMAQIGVWNGARYEYSQWDTVGRYSNYGQFGIYNSDYVCRASAL